MENDLSDREAIFAVEGQSNLGSDHESSDDEGHDEVTDETCDTRTATTHEHQLSNHLSMSLSSVSKPQDEEDEPIFDHIPDEVMAKLSAVSSQTAECAAATTSDQSSRKVPELPPRSYDYKKLKRHSHAGVFFRSGKSKSLRQRKTKRTSLMSADEYDRSTGQAMNERARSVEERTASRLQPAVEHQERRGQDSAAALGTRNGQRQGVRRGRSPRKVLSLLLNPVQLLSKKSKGSYQSAPTTPRRPRKLSIVEENPEVIQQGTTDKRSKRSALKRDQESPTHKQRDCVDYDVANGCRAQKCRGHSTVSDQTSSCCQPPHKRFENYELVTDEDRSSWSAAFAHLSHQSSKATHQQRSVRKAHTRKDSRESMYSTVDKLSLKSFLASLDDMVPSNGVCEDVEPDEHDEHDSCIDDDGYERVSLGSVTSDDDDDDLF